MATNEALADFLSNPDGDNLCKLLRKGDGEFDNLDYKELWPPGPKLARDILGFANSGGGCLVVGVRQDDDGTMNPVGVDRLLDKTPIFESVKKFVPESLDYDVHIIDETKVNGSDRREIEGRKFQVLRVLDRPERLPFLAIADGNELRAGVVYVRKGVSTRLATHDQLQKVINRRIETGYSTERELTLREHLEELKVLYAEWRPADHYFASMVSSMFNSGANYNDFIGGMIERKKEIVASLLQR